jgi:tRNA A-37 threonylcarbamoyl transferase component Bud32
VTDESPVGRWRRRLFRRDPDRSTRRASDVGRLVVAGAVFAVLAAHAGHEGRAEHSLVRFVAALPQGLRTPLEALYGLAVLWVIGLVVVAVIIGRRWRLARDIGLAAVLTWVAARMLGTLLEGIGFGDALDALTKAGASPHFPLTRLAIVTAAVAVASPHLVRPVRLVGQVLIGLLTIAALYLATAFPGDLLGAIVLGWAVAAAVHVMFGVPVGHPAVEQVRAALARLGVPVDVLRRAERSPAGAAAFVAGDPAGELRVTVLGRDDLDAQLLAKVSRWAAYRHESPLFFVTRRQQVEYEAYVMLRARDGGARVPSVAAAGAPTPRIALVATRAAVGPRLSTLGRAVTDAQLQDLWAQVSRLHEAGVAHGRLSADAVVVTPSGPVIVDFGAATTTPDEYRRSADLAELLAATSALVGVERAVAAAASVDRAALGAALPLIQAPALTASTREACGGSQERDRVLDELRTATARAAGAEVPELAKLARVRLRTLAMTIGTLVAVFALLSRVGDPATFWDTMRDASWGYVALAFVAALLTNLAFSIAFLGTVPTRVAFWPVVWLQTAMGFSNVALPAGAESAVQVRFLQKQGLDLASALAVGGVLSTVSEFAVQLALFGVAVWLAPARIDIGNVPVGSMAAVIAIVVLAIGGLAAVVFGVRRIRQKVVPHVRRAARTMWDAIRSPGRIALLVVGNVAAQALYAGALLASLHAFGVGASFWTLLALNIGVSTIAGLVPVPGADTAVSTIGMSGALVAAGVPEAAAAAAVLTNTVVTSYLPAIPGWFATNYLVRHDQL